MLSQVACCFPGAIWEATERLLRLVQHLDQYCTLFTCTSTTYISTSTTGENQERLQSSGSKSEGCGSPDGLFVVLSWTCHSGQSPTEMDASCELYYRNWLYGWCCRQPLGVCNHGYFFEKQSKKQDPSAKPCCVLSP